MSLIANLHRYLLTMPPEVMLVKRDQNENTKGGGVSAIQPPPLRESNHGYRDVKVSST